MQHYLIIGASSGIGLELAKQLTASGHRVTGTFNNNDPKLEIPNLRFHQFNVLDENPDMSFLPEELNGLIYCPGTINLRPFERIKPKDFEADLQLQVIGAIKIIQLALPALKKTDQASIILFSTFAVQTGLPFHSQVAVSKGAIEGLSRALAAEYAPKLRVNCIAPSLTDTPLAASLLNSESKRQANSERHPLKRYGHAKDIANMAEFLLSDKASWITGQVLHVDGGISSLKI